MLGMEAGGWGSGLGSLTEFQGAVDICCCYPLFLDRHSSFPLGSHLASLSPGKSWGTDTDPHCTPTPGGGIVYPGLAIDSSADLRPGDWFKGWRVSHVEPAIV